MSEPQLLLGIDGGGSSTRAVLANLDGLVLGVGSAGSSNPFSGGLEASRSAIDLAVSGAFAKAGIPRRPVGWAVLGIAGLVTEDERAGISNVASELALARRHQVYHDLHIALTGSLLGKPGAVLVAGTGSACYVRNGDGREVITGGKGPLAGDSGSAYWIALRALRTAVKQFDGRLPRGPLADAVLEHLETDDPSGLPARIHRDGLSTSQLARLTPRVIRLAAAGDEASAGIVAAAHAALTNMLQTALLRVSLTEPKVVFAGGLATSEPFGIGLRKRIQVALPEAVFCNPVLPPAGGAILEAFSLAGIDKAEQRVEALVSGLTQL